MPLWAGDFLTHRAPWPKWPTMMKPAVLSCDGKIGMCQTLWNLKQKGFPKHDCSYSTFLPGFFSSCNVLSSSLSCFKAIRTNVFAKVMRYLTKEFCKKTFCTQIIMLYTRRCKEKRGL